MLFRVLGPIEVGDGAVGVQGMPRRLLAALLVASNRVVPVAALLDALWGDAQPATATGTLHTHVSRLRARLAPLGPAVRLLTREPGYVLEVDPGEVDAGRFERLVQHARDAATPEEALAAYDEALSLWRGAALAEFADEEFARPAAVRLEDMRLSAAEERIEVLLGLDRHADVQGDLEELVAAHPLRERFRAQLMVARYRSGRTADALAVFRDYRERLAADLGLDPSQALSRLERDILNQSPQLQARPAVTEAAPPAAEPPPVPDAPPPVPDAPPPVPDAPPPGPAPATAAEPERKLLTLLLVEVDAPLDAAADPEEVLASVEPAIEAAQAAVHRYDGTVYRVSSHGLAALFGAPLAQEDHAVRAAYAALAIARGAGAGDGLPLRVAVQSGHVLVRTVRTDLSVDYEPVGAAVQEAERLLASTEPGAVSASEETMRLAAGRVEAREVTGGGEVTGPGRPRRWRLLRATGHSPFQARVLRGRTAFAGRGAELDLLAARLATAATGLGQIVAVVGEAGVGKSRLCAEFLERAVPPAWTTLTVAAAPTESRVPYHPLASMLRAWLHLPDDRRHEEVAAALERRCAGLGVGALTTPLLAVLDLAGGDARWQELEPGQRRRRIHGALIDLLLALATGAPLLLVVEDLHWIDAETSAVLDAVVDAATAAPLLLLATYRPEHVPAWVNRSHVTTLHLAPLRAGEASRFLSSLLGDDPRLEGLKGRLLEWTGGSPFYLEETVSALAEDGVLAGAPGVYRLVDPGAPVTVPTSVHAVLAERLDRLPPHQKSLLQAAAVIGTAGPLDVLLDCVDAPEDQVAADLAALRHAEFLYERRDAHGVAFTFKHAITHDAVYASLSRAGRRRLHRRVAGALRARSDVRSGEALARLGLHALGAEDWAEAATLLRQAAEQALDRSAHKDAAELLEQAVDALGRLGRTPETVAVELDARMALRPAVAARGDLRRALAHLARAEELAREVGDDARLIAIKVHQSFSHDLLGHVADAVATGEEGLRIATRLGDEVGEAECRLAIAQAYALSGDAPRVLSTLAPSTALLTGALRFERHGQAGVRGVWALGHTALAHAIRGESERATATAAEAAEVARAGGRTVDRGFSAFVDGFVATQRGDDAGAARAFRSGIDITTEGDVPLIGMWGRAWLGHVLVRRGDVGGGEAVLRDLLGEVVEAGIVLVEAWVRTHLAHLALATGDARAATVEAEAALRLASRWRHPFTEARALHVLGTAAAALGDGDAAETWFASSLAIAGDLGARPLAARTLLSRGLARAAAGAVDAARTDLEAAASQAGELGLDAERRAARTALAELA